MIFCGIPIFYQEVALGQYLGVGGMTLISQLAPIMKGTHYLSLSQPFFKKLFKRSGLRYNDNRLLHRHLLLRHYRLDTILLNRLLHRFTWSSMASLRYPNIQL